ncbi:MAG TPA: EAL domain-containing protein [Oxalicibacterium sp.]|uniref:EAL domain-containing protein n=1 Tax=Oxalicibacterium sp. TaxID=2766525 RepID=UPI002B8C8707|nr:EAL domain-containing protein [Oxalicibacterium sp.]HWU97772.1 EAL domain-containing protein [Oxalicibacterium sp.]
MKKTLGQRFNFDSLRIRLLVLVLLAIVPPVILTVYGAWKERQQAIRIAEDNLQQMTQLAATSEARMIEGARQLLSVLSTLPELQGNAKTCNQFLANVLQRNQGYTNFGLIQLNGDVSCSAIPLQNKINLGSRTYFKQTVEQRTFTAGDYVFGRTSRKHTINLTYPVLDNKGNVRSVIFAALDLSYLDRFVSDIALPSGAVLITADSRGTIIARRPDPEKWIGTRTPPSLFDVMIKVGFGTSELTDSDGIRRLHAFAPVGTSDVSNFKVSIGIPMDDIVAPANHLQMMELTTLAVIALLALVAAWFVGDVIILRRVKALVRTADQVGAGNLHARTGIRYGKEEISQLARAFDGMVASLRQHEAEREESKAILFTEKERAQVTLESIADAVITTDKLGNIEYMNPVAEELTGWSKAEAEGLPSARVFKIVNGFTREPVANPVEMVLEQQSNVELSKDTVLLSRNGTEYAVEDSAAPIRNREGEIIGVVLVFHDVSDSRQLAIQLSHQAAHDPLTGLFNRREFERRLELAIDTLARQSRQHALLYLDLDQFKIVNDTCGHSAGDELLRQITALLQPLVRDSDTLARLGGDEFGAFLENCSPESAVRIAEKLRQTICDFHFVWQDKIFPIGVSIGLVNFSNNALSLPDLLSAADTACYIAKDTGRNRVHIYRTEDHQLATREGEVKWNERIQKAFENDAFRLQSQKIVNLRPNRKNHLFDELCLYLADDNGKLIPTSAFMPAAERYHFMPTIDRWIIRTAFAQHAATLDAMDTSGEIGQHLLMLKISGNSLDDEHFLEFVHEQFAEFGVPYNAICFSIAETTAITNLTRALRFIEALKPRGCSFALGDFGSGMSSFAYLKHLHVDYLKIDGGYIKGMAHDPVDYAKVEAIQRISSVMGIDTIAQNVDDANTLARLQKVGVGYAQGSFVGKAVSFYPPAESSATV